MSKFFFSYLVISIMFISILCNAQEDRYLVGFDKSLEASSSHAYLQDLGHLVKKLNGKIRRHYTSVFKGFAIKISPKYIKHLQRIPGLIIERDRVIQISRFNTVAGKEIWGLDRIDQRELPLDNLIYSPLLTGEGVSVYVIDTGIEKSHSEFHGVEFGESYWAIKDEDPFDDCNGHGTHVAGTVGGRTVGVAREVKLHAVKVLNCQGSGTYSGIADAMEWVIKNKEEVSVANMSLGGSKSALINDAVKSMVEAGITVVVAAGNETQDACKVSPASEPTAITVGATTSSDYRAYFSNYGKCVDIYAPGHSIKSAKVKGGYVYNSGTSMASPHVAGAAALYLSTFFTATPKEVDEALKLQGTKDLLKGLKKDDPNILLNINF